MADDNNTAVAGLDEKSINKKPHSVKKTKTGNANKASSSGAKQKRLGKKKQSSSGKAILAVIAFFILMFLAVFLIRYMGSSNEDPEQIYQDVLQGDHSDDNYVYNGFVFIKYNNLSYTKLQSGNTIFTVPFRFGPREVEDVVIEGDVLEFGRIVVGNYSRQVYITFDPAEPDLKYVGLANGELSLNVVKTLGITPTAACTQNFTGCGEAPIMQCNPEGEPVIYLSQEEGPKVTVDGNCLTVQGKGFDLVKATDRLLLTWYRIVDN